MKTKKVLMILASTIVLMLQASQLHAQSWDDFWGSVTNAFEDATKSAKEMLKQTVDIGGQTVDFGPNAIGAATQQALNAQTAAYGAAKSLNAKAFVYFREAVPLPQLWDIAEKLSKDNFDNQMKLDDARKASIVYGEAVATRMLNAAKNGDWESIWDFASGYTGYLTIEPQPNCPRPLMVAIFVYDPKTERFRTVSMNPNLNRGNLTYIYAAPRLELPYRQQTNPDEINPYDFFIGGVAQIDVKTQKVIWDYSGPSPVLQKSRWQIDFVDGKFDTRLVADDGNINDKPARPKNTPLPADVPSKVNDDMNNTNVPYCRNMAGVYTFPVDKGKIIRFGDIVTLESMAYNFYLDADDDMCRPLGLGDGIDKQWQIIDPYDCNSAYLKIPVHAQQMVALRSIRYGGFLDADDNCVTPFGNESSGTDKRWWFVNPDDTGSKDYLRSGHVMGLAGNWKNRFLDADDNRCTADGNGLGSDKQWRVQLHPEYDDTRLLVGPPDGEYRIRVKADGHYLHEDGLGNNLVTGFDQGYDDDFMHFILEKQADESYRIRVKANGRHLHVNEFGDKLMSTRFQPDDEYTRFFLEKMTDGCFRIRVKGSCRYLHENGLGDKLVSTRAQPDDDFTRFYFEK